MTPGAKKSPPPLPPKQASPLQPAPKPPTQQPPSSPPDGATEHVLLSPDDLRRLRREDAARLHEQARQWTNYYANTIGPAVGVVGNLSVVWPNWKLYIAHHKDSEAIVGPGVVAFTAEFIQGTKDPNRGGIPRLDLVVRRVDGGYVRLHPGTKATFSFVVPSGFNQISEQRGSFNFVVPLDSVNFPELTHHVFWPGEAHEPINQ